MIGLGLALRVVAALIGGNIWILPRWWRGVAGNMITAWILTIPITRGIAYGLYMALRAIGANLPAQGYTHGHE